MIHLQRRTMKINISSELIQYFASLSLPAHVSVNEALRDGPGDIRHKLQKCMSEIPIASVRERFDSPTFHCLLRGNEKENYERQRRRQCQNSD